MLNYEEIGIFTSIKILYLHIFKEGYLILDQFASGGITLTEVKFFRRNIIGIDVNFVEFARYCEKIDFEHESAYGKIYLRKGHVRHLELISNSSIDIICTHTSYANITQHSEDIEEDI